MSAPGAVAAFAMEFASNYALFDYFVDGCHGSVMQGQEEAKDDAVRASAKNLKLTPSQQASLSQAIRQQRSQAQTLRLIKLRRQRIRSWSLPARRPAGPTRRPSNTPTRRPPVKHACPNHPPFNASTMVDVKPKIFLNSPNPSRQRTRRLAACSGYVSLHRSQFTAPTGLHGARPHSAHARYIHGQLVSNSRSASHQPCYSRRLSTIRGPDSAPRNANAEASDEPIPVSSSESYIGAHNPQVSGLGSPLGSPESASLLEQAPLAAVRNTNAACGQVLADCEYESEDDTAVLNDLLASLQPALYGLPTGTGNRNTQRRQRSSHTMGTASTASASGPVDPGQVAGHSSPGSSKASAAGPRLHTAERHRVRTKQASSSTNTNRSNPSRAFCQLVAPQTSTSATAVKTQTAQSFEAQALALGPGTSNVSVETPPDLVSTHSVPAPLSAPDPASTDTSCALVQDGSSIVSIAVREPAQAALATMPVSMAPSPGNLCSTLPPSFATGAVCAVSSLPSVTDGASSSPILAGSSAGSLGALLVWFK
eukprot:gene6533-1165_t